jgi:transposase
MIDEKKLPADVEKLKAIIGQQITFQQQQIQKYETQLQTKDEQIKARDDEITILQEALRLARIQRFASHSEKLPSNQSELFNEAEVLASAEEEKETEEDSIEVPAHARKRPKREPLPADLPREIVIIDLPENEKICPIHGVPLRETGREVSEKLDIVPAQIKVVQTIRIKYIRDCCVDEANMQTAPLPETILPKSNATAGLLAYIATSKYVDALPLYRLEKIFERYGVVIPRNTMCRWMIGLLEKLTPLYNMMEEDLLASDYICCDETRTQVLNEPGKTPQSQSYMWVRTRHGPGISPIVLFDYDPTRAKEVANQLLKGFKGYLQADGYGSYDEVCLSLDIIRLGCMAHVRRNFFDVFKASEKKNQDAKHVLLLIKKLYKVEKEIKDKTIEERFQIRLEKSKPILDKIKAWLDVHQNHFGLMGKAVTYATNQWDYVINYLKDGRLEIDNNFTENRIRPFAVGRKNWLFSDSVAGAKASAMIYSILQTARANGLEPFVYMKYLLTELPKCKTAEQIEKLLPHKIDYKVLYSKS